MQTEWKLKDHGAPEDRGDLWLLIVTNACLWISNVLDWMGVL